MEDEKLQFDDIFSKKADKEVEIQSPEDELDVPEMKVDVQVHFDKIESNGDQEDFQSDIQYLRTKLLRSIAQADKILTSLLKKISIDDEIIDSSDTPRGYYRYYEVSTQILKQICDASKELVNLHTANMKTKKEMGWIDTLESIDPSKPKEGTKTLVNIIQELKKTGAINNE